MQPLRTLYTHKLESGHKLVLYRNYAATVHKYIVYCNRGPNLFPINELFSDCSSAIRVVRQYLQNPLFK